jgi:hypothetical protein
MSALDDRIQRVVDAAIRKERAFMRQVIAEVIVAHGGLNGDALERIDADIRELFARGPDRNGVYRRQYHTPQPRPR